VRIDSLSINKRFLEEAKLLGEKWAKSGLLDKLLKDRPPGTVLLESCRLEGPCPLCNGRDHGKGE